MKKTLLMALMVWVCCLAEGQNKDTIGMNLPFKDGRLLYTGIVDAPSKNKIELYKNAQQWLVDYFNSAKDVIQNQDKEDGFIVGKGVLKFNSGIGLGMIMSWGENVTIKIECKDNEYRYSFYDISISYYYAGGANYSIGTLIGKITGGEHKGWGWSKKSAKDVLINCDNELKLATLSLNEAMIKNNSDF